MKYLDGKEVMRGDMVIAAIDAGKSVTAGTVHEIYERTEQVRITGYALRVETKDCVLAQEAFNAYAGPILKAKAEAAAKAKEESDKKAAEAAGQAAPQVPQQSAENIAQAQPPA